MRDIDRNVGQVIKVGFLKNCRVTNCCRSKNCKKLQNDSPYSLTQKSIALLNIYAPFMHDCDLCVLKGLHKKKFLETI